MRAPELVECVPNFSEGRRPEVVERIADAAQSVEGVRLLDRTMDHDHNRSVLTFVGAPEACAEAAFRSVAEAVSLIDMRQHKGEHPRIGAADVVPFVPLRGTTLEQCADLARGLAQRIWDELSVPVYLYGAAAARPERKDLAVIRRGGYEALVDEVRLDSRAPDVGERRLHPTAGATIVGARRFLIAFNINLATGDLSVARKIARAVRGSSGGLECVKALGVELGQRGIVQVTMNLTDYTRSSIPAVFELVKAYASRYGTAIAGCELVGLAPLDALLAVAEHFLAMEHPLRDRVLESRIWDELA